MTLQGPRSVLELLILSYVVRLSSVKQNFVYNEATERGDRTYRCCTDPSSTISSTKLSFIVH
jgi:hypothetical protein